MSLRVLMLNWRDLHHPEAGGAEKYLVTVAEGLAGRGHQVTFRTAAYPGAKSDETVAGVRYVRRGGHHSIYPRAVLGRTQKRHDIVIDVQNGVPYLSPLVTRTPVVNLVHHVHREQWPVVFGPRSARLGWWLEGSVAPLVYRRSTYVTVSDSTRRELIALGVDNDRIRLIHNGTDAVETEVQRSPTPRIIVLGRLVPHKRVEIALTAVAVLRSRIPDIAIDVVGTGWWEPEVRSRARSMGIEDLVTFHGHVSAAEKHRLLARAWVHALPSLKEGWGLVVVEAGVHGTPTVAFREAGGPVDSIRHERTGLLVDDSPTPGLGEEAFASAIGRLLTDHGLRERMSGQAQAWVSRFHWDDCIDAWEQLLLREVGT